MSASRARGTARQSRPGIESVDDAALVADVVIATFRLNDRLMDAAGRLAVHGGLTSTEWQVIGGVLDEPRTLAEIGRRMGITRQGARRVGAALVARGLAEVRPNPAHARASLLAATPAGREAIERIALVQRPWASDVVAQLGADDLRNALVTLERLARAVEAAESPSS